MPSISKKRKAPEPSAAGTLHDFFGGQSSSSKKKPNNTQKSPALFRNKEVDVIVIDSDEDEVHSKSSARIPRKRQPASTSRRSRVRDSSSDVEVVPNHVQVKAERAEDLHEFAEGRPAVKCEAPISFGVAGPLLAPERQSHSDTLMKSLPDQKIERSLESSAKIPTGRPIDLPDVGAELDCTPPPSRLPTSNSTEMIADVLDGDTEDLGITSVDQSAAADWDLAMGDDEMLLEDDVDMEFDEEKPDLNNGDTPPMPSDIAAEVLICPVCSKSLKNLFATERQTHVNKCIDIASAPPARLQTPTPCDKRKPLQPLSSLRQPTPGPSSNANAFSVLMSGHSDHAAWEEAEENEDKTFRPTKANGGRRKAPFYKVLQGMPIAVDAFRYGSIPGVTAYFLTHAHSDHYTNLASNWKSGPIYCSETTANLVIHMLSVDKKWVHPLPMDVPTEIPNTGSVKVTLIEANHCPGSSLFLFEGRQTVNAGDSVYKSPYVGALRQFRYLHCGDFRACPQHVLHPAVRGKRIDHVYLDTTYLNPKYCFPPQPLVISACAELARRIVTGEQLGPDPDESAKKGSTIQDWTISDKKGKGKETSHNGSKKTLIVVGTYSIGKERIVKAIAKALNTKVYCDARKTAILRCQSDPELHALLTSDPYAAGVHVVPLGMIASDRFQEYMDKWQGHFGRAVGFRPTGWTYTPPAGTDQSPGIQFVISRDQRRIFTHAHLKPMRNSTPRLMLYGVPYSEHSSFFELTCFALSLDWGRIIATVNVGTAASRSKIQRWVDKWEAERKRLQAASADGKSGVIQFRRADYW